MVMQSETIPMKKVTTYYWPATSQPCTKSGHVQRLPQTFVRYAFSDRSKSSVLLPKFKPGEFLIKPYAVSSHRLEGNPISATVSVCRKDGGFVVDEWSGNAVGLTQVYNACEKGTPRPDAALTSVRLRALAKVNSGELTLAQEFGELKETLAMLESPLSDLRRFLERKPWKDFDNLRFAYNYFKHHPGDIGKHAQRFLMPASNTWLEWRYGLRPLLLTIEDLLELAGKQLRKSSDRVLTRRRRQVVFDTVSSRTERLGDTEVKLVTKKSLLVEGIAYYQRISDQTWSEFLGMDPCDLPSTAWELARLSFVVDWIFSIGDWIRALTPPRSVKLLGSSQSWRYSNRTEIQCRFFSSENANIGTDFQKAGIFESDTFNREVMGTSTPVPMFKGASDIDLQRAIDALTLIHTGVTRKLQMIKRSRNVSR